MHIKRKIGSAKYYVDHIKRQEEANFVQMQKEIQILHWEIWRGNINKVQLGKYYILDLRIIIVICFWHRKIFWVKKCSRRVQSYNIYGCIRCKVHLLGGERIKRWGLIPFCSRNIGMRHAEVMCYGRSMIFGTIRSMAQHFIQYTAINKFLDAPLPKATLVEIL